MNLSPGVCGPVAEPIEKKWGSVRNSTGRSVTPLFCQLAFLDGMARKGVKVDVTKDLIVIKGEL